MKMNATEITARREQIKTTRANIKTVVNIYSERQRLDHRRDRGRIDHPRMGRRIHRCRGGESMNSYKFAFRCVDNGGKHQAFTVSAPNKAAAIEKALKKAEKNAAGDICGRWEIKLQPSF